MAKVYVELACDVVLMSYEIIRVKVGNLVGLSRYLFMKVMFTICSFTMFQVNLYYIMHMLEIYDYVYIIVSYSYVMFD